MRLLITHSLHPSTELGRHAYGRGGQIPRHKTGAGDETDTFNAATSHTGPDAGHAGETARGMPTQALATARDVLNFRVQTVSLPGPGSVAPFVAQQIGQLWIAPDGGIGHDRAAAAYRRANDAADRVFVDAAVWPLTA